VQLWLIFDVIYYIWAQDASAPISPALTSGVASSRIPDVAAR